MIPVREGKRALKGLSTAGSRLHGPVRSFLDLVRFLFYSQSMPYLLKPSNVRTMNPARGSVLPPMETAKAGSEGNVGRALLGYFAEKSRGGNSQDRALRDFEDAP